MNSPVKDFSVTGLFVLFLLFHRRISERISTELFLFWCPLLDFLLIFINLSQTISDSQAKAA
jgi:hypothetical protein